MAVTTRNTLGKGAKVFVLVGQLIIESIMNFYIIREIMTSIWILRYDTGRGQETKVSIRVSLIC